MRDARVHLLPYTQPHPEVCVASAVTPSGGRLAGKYDLGMLCVAAGESAGFDALDTNWAVANEIAAEHGRTMDRQRLRIVLNMHLAETREQAKENIRFGTKQFVDYFNNNMPRLHVPEGVDPVDWVVEHKVAVVGTADDAIARIERVHEKQGEFGCLLLQAHNWAPWAATKRSYELYARYVMPHFSRRECEPVRVVRLGHRAPGRADREASRGRAADVRQARRRTERQGERCGHRPPGNGQGSMVRTR